MSQSLNKNRYLIRTQTATEIGLVPVLAMAIILIDNGDTCTLSVDKSDYRHFIDGLTSVQVIHDGHVVAEWNAPAAKDKAHEHEIKRRFDEFMASNPNPPARPDWTFNKRASEDPLVNDIIKKATEKVIQEAIQPGGLLHSFLRNR